MSYKGKVALIFGATSRIGQAVAKEMASQGADVALHYNSNETAVKELLSAVKKLNSSSNVSLVKANGQKKEEVARAVAQAAKIHGRIDFLIVLFTQPFDVKAWNETDEKATDKAYADAFAIDVMGTKRAMDAAIPFLKKTKGSIVNFSSSPVISGYSEGTAYSVAKAAVKQLTMDYAQKYGKFGIRINAIAPGWVPHGTEKKSELEEAKKKTPLGQLGSPEKIAQVVADVLLWEHVTGQTIVVDGGEVMR